MSGEQDKKQGCLLAFQKIVSQQNIMSPMKGAEEIVGV